MIRKEYVPKRNCSRKRRRRLRRVVAGACVMTMLAGSVLSPLGDILPLHVMSTEAVQAAVKSMTETVTIDVGNVKDSHASLEKGTMYYRISENESYRLTGSNRINGSYVETQIVVEEGVEATLILDGLDIQNKKGSMEFASYGSYNVSNEGTPALDVKGKAKLMVAGDSALSTEISTAGCIFVEEGAELTMTKEAEKEGTLTVTTGKFAPCIGVYGEFTIEDGDLSLSGMIGIGQADQRYGSIHMEGGTTKIQLPKVLPNDSGAACGFGHYSMDSDAEESLDLQISDGNIEIIAGNSERLSSFYGIGDYVKADISGGTITLGTSTLGFQYPIYSEGSIRGGDIIAYLDKSSSSSYVLPISTMTVKGGNFSFHATEGRNKKLSVAFAENAKDGNYIIDEELLSVSFFGKISKYYSGTLTTGGDKRTLQYAYMLGVDDEGKTTSVYMDLSSCETDTEGRFGFFQPSGITCSDVYLTYLAGGEQVTKRYTPGEQTNGKTPLILNEEAQTAYRAKVHDISLGEDYVFAADSEGNISYPSILRENGNVKYFADADCKEEAPVTLTADTQIYAKEIPYAIATVKDIRTDQTCYEVKADQEGNVSLPDGSSTEYETYAYYVDKDRSKKVELTCQISGDTTFYLDRELKEYTITFEEEGQEPVVRTGNYGQSVDPYPEEDGYVYLYDGDSQLEPITEDATITVYRWKKYTDGKYNEYIQIDTKEDYIRYAKMAEERYSSQVNLYLACDLTLDTTEYYGNRNGYNIGIFEGNHHTVTALHSDTTMKFHGFISYAKCATFQNVNWDIKVTGVMNNEAQGVGYVVGASWGNTYTNCTLTAECKPSSGVPSVCMSNYSGNSNSSEVYENCTMDVKTYSGTMETAFVFGTERMNSDGQSLHLTNCYISSSNQADSQNTVLARNPWVVMAQGKDYNKYKLAVDLKNCYASPTDNELTYSEDTNKADVGLVDTMEQAVSAWIAMDPTGEIFDVLAPDADHSYCKMVLSQVNQENNQIHYVAYRQGDTTKYVAGATDETMTEEEQSIFTAQTYYYYDGTTKKVFDPAQYTFDQNIVVFTEAQTIVPMVNEDKDRNVSVWEMLEKKLDLDAYMQPLAEGYEYAYTFEQGALEQYLGTLNRYTIAGQSLSILQYLCGEEDVWILASVMKDDEVKSDVPYKFKFHITGSVDDDAPVISRGETILDPTRTEGYTYCKAQTFVIEDENLFKVLYDGNEVSLTDGCYTIETSKTGDATGQKELTAIDVLGNSATVLIDIDITKHQYENGKCSECGAIEPTPSPSPTTAPTSEATAAPTSDSTTAPTSEATTAPTSDSTTAPTSEATTSPTSDSTTAPTSKAPTAPTSEATTAPTAESTAAPTKAPTIVPSTVPTATVTIAPSIIQPIVVPSIAPSVSPNGKESTVKPAKVSAVKVLLKKKVLTVTWKKAKNAKSYEVQISKNKKFKKNKKYKTKSYSVKVTKKKIKGLSKKTTYYVRVRALNGKKVYGSWSKNVKKKI